MQGIPLSTHARYPAARIAKISHRRAPYPPLHPPSWGASGKSRMELSDQPPGKSAGVGNPNNSRKHPTYAAARFAIARIVDMRMELESANSIAIGIP